MMGSPSRLKVFMSTAWDISASPRTNSRRSGGAKRGIAGVSTSLIGVPPFKLPTYVAATSPSVSAR